MDDPEYKIIPFENQLIGLSLAVTGILGITGNLLCFRTFWVERRNSYFHMQLLIANTIHLLSVVFAGPSAIRGRWLFGNAFCSWYGAQVMISSLAEVLFTTLVCVECYTAVCHRLYYEKQSQNVFAGISAFVWLSSLAFGVLPLIGWNRYLPDMPAVVCAIDMVNGARFAQSFLTVTQAVFVGGGLLAAVSVLVAYKSSSRESLTFEPLFNDKQLVKICGFLLLLLVLGDLPYFIRVLYNLLEKPSIFKYRLGVELTHVARQLGSCLQPFVYLGFSRDFRHLSQAMITGVTPEKKNQ